MMQTNCSETCLEIYERTCACERVDYAKVIEKKKQNCFLGFRQVDAGRRKSTEISQNIYKIP